MMVKNLFQKLTGKSENHLVSFENHLIHKEVLDSFIKLRNEAAREGFDLTIGSAFRSFSHQLKIWNKKASGELPLLNRKEKKIEPPSNQEELLFAILNWSAIPGTSRHHWGTDLDVFDKNALPKDQALQLTTKEANTIFAPLHLWLDQRIKNRNAFGLYRPYEKDLGGVMPEKWHLSHLETANIYYEQFSIEIFQKIVDDPAIKLREEILKNADYIFSHFIKNISS